MPCLWSTNTATPWASSPWPAEPQQAWQNHPLVHLPVRHHALCHRPLPLRPAWLYRAVVTSLVDEFSRRPVPRTGCVDEFGRHRVSCQGSIGVLLVKGAGHAADVEGRAV